MFITIALLNLKLKRPPIYLGKFCVTGRKNIYTEKGVSLLARVIGLS